MNEERDNGELNHDCCTQAKRLPVVEAERDRLLVIVKRLRNIADTVPIVPRVFTGTQAGAPPHFHFEDEPTHSFLVALGVDARDLLAELEGART